MKETIEVIAETYRYCPICDGKHKMPLTKRTVYETVLDKRQVKYIEIFNLCSKNDYELEVCKQVKETNSKKMNMLNTLLKNI